MEANRTSLYKGVTRVAWEKIAATQLGYEMDCLISAEFTPAPDYLWAVQQVEKLLARYGATLDEYMAWLTEMTERSYNPFGSSIYEITLGFLQYPIEEADEHFVHHLF